MTATPPAPTPTDETQRLQALRDYALLDTPPEQGFDDIVFLASTLCGTPVALVSLVAGDRQWFKARVGFPRGETSLDESICAHALRATTTLVIPDLTTDGRTARNPLVVGEPFLRFYAGAPLLTPEGRVLGTLCVLDHRPRSGGLSAEQARGLEALARQVMTQAELRRSIAGRDALVVEQMAAQRERDALRRTQGAIASAGGDLDAILDALVEGAMEAVPAAEAGVIELIDGDALEYRAVRGTVVPHLGLRVPLRGSLAGRCALDDLPILLRDARLDPRVKQDLIAPLDLRAAVFAPVGRAGKVLGVLKLHSSRPDAFSDRDLELARLFAGAATAGLTEVRELVARRAVETSETRYRAIFDSAIDYAIIVLDLEGQVVDWNTGAAKILGWTIGAIRGKPAAVFFTPEDREAGVPEDEMRSALLTGRGLDERWHLRETGERFWANGEMMTLRDGAGSAIGFVKILRDRTEQRRDFERIEASERQLLLEQGMLRGILQQAPIGISIAFADGQAMLNQRAERMIGHAGGRGHDRYDDFQAVHADGRRYEPGDYPTVRALRLGETIEGEAMLYRPGGGDLLRRWEVSSAPVRGRDGTITAAVTTFVDKEEQLQAEEALRSSEERLSLAFQASGSLGWFDWTMTEDRLRVGAFFARMYGVDPAAAAAGVPIATFTDRVHPDDRGWAGARLREAITADTLFDAEYRLLAGDGAVTWVHSLGRSHASKDGRPGRFVGVVVDVTARVAADQRRLAMIELGDLIRGIAHIPEMVREVSALVGRTMGVTRAGFGRLDQGGDHVDVEAAWNAPGEASIAGRHRLSAYGTFAPALVAGEAVAIDDVSADPRTRADPGPLHDLGVGALVNMPVRERGRTVAIFLVHNRRPRAWTVEEVSFLRAVADRVEAGVARVMAEEQQKLVNHELSHRLKNTLAMVQAIATQTMRNASDLSLAKETLSARLIALSQAHDILLSGTGDGADIHAVIAGALKLHDDLEPGRLCLRGPAVRTDARAALSLSLMMHELATNATKYGALSTAGGTVTVGWTLAGIPAAQELRLVWREQGGPAVTVPSRKGFGSRLIERGFSGAVGAAVALDYRPDGLVCTLDVPVAGLSGEH